MAFNARFDVLRNYFNTGITHNVAWRKEQLRRLKDLISKEQQVLHDALFQDLGKNDFSSWLTETNMILANIQFFSDNIESLAKPQKVSTPPTLQPGRSYVVREPLGVVLIIAPWNYPVQLALMPLAAVLAAGNVAVIKPSEISPAVSSAMAHLIPKYFDNNVVTVVEGAVKETQEIMQYRFDHIFFTGSTRVGKIIYEGAAKHLTPVTLELGGKSPVYVDDTADIDATARRIIFGKCMNAGQTCVAPDYVLCSPKIQDKLASKLASTVEYFYGSDPSKSDDYARIVSAPMGTRLEKMLNEDKQKGRVELVSGGRWDSPNKYFAPTVLKNVKEDAALMQEEIFGPILPILPVVKDATEAARFISARPKPLVVMMFSSDKTAQTYVRDHTSSGAYVVNDALVHMANEELPFGGVGESGMGRYHGVTGLDTFSNLKSVFNNSTLLDPSVRYPPFTPGKIKVVKFLSNFHIPRGAKLLFQGLVVVGLAWVLANSKYFRHP